MRKIIIYLLSESFRSDFIFRHLIYYKYPSNIRNDRNVSDISRTNKDLIPILMRFRKLSLTAPKCDWLGFAMEFVSRKLVSVWNLK